jgi:pimeloyl-ACP methyl ester carboxylesterase
LRTDDSKALVIPGIGGHPIFHRRLISCLEQRGLKVFSAPYGDFFSAPYGTLRQHTDYWVDHAKSLGLNNLSIIAISFGANIVLGFPAELISRLETLILVSHWPIMGVERTILRNVHLLNPALAKWAVSQFLFCWSEITADSISELKEIRSELYDSPLKVRERLFARILCLVAAPIATAVKLDCPTYLVYGRSELGFRLHRRELHKLQRNGNIQILQITGGHEISTSDTPALSNIICEILGGKPSLAQGLDHVKN